MSRSRTDPDSFAVSLLRQHGAGRRPLDPLWNISLHQPHGTLRATFGPSDRLQPPGGKPDARRNRQQPPTRGRLAQHGHGGQRRRQHSGEGDQQHTAHGRPPRQRRIEEGIAGEEPGEAGEKPGQRPFHEHPQRREGERGRHRRVQPTTMEAPGQKTVEKRHAGNEQRHEGGSQWRRRGAVDVDADVDPGRADTVLAHAEEPSPPERPGAGFGARQQPEQHTRRDQHQRPDVEGRQRQRQQGAGGQRRSRVRRRGQSARDSSFRRGRSLHPAGVL